MGDSKAIERVKPIMLIIAGALAVVLAIACFTQKAGSTEPSYSYGGDAYTGIQNAGAQTANNVYALGSVVGFGFGSVLVVMGVALLGCGIAGLRFGSNGTAADAAKSTAETGPTATVATQATEPVAIEETVEEASAEDYPDEAVMAAEASALSEEAGIASEETTTD